MKRATISLCTAGVLWAGPAAMAQTCITDIHVGNFDTDTPTEMWGGGATIAGIPLRLPEAFQCVGSQRQCPRFVVRFAPDMIKEFAIVVANAQQTVGIGAGQMSRVDACQLAVGKAQLPTAGTVAASDAFFPFRDGLDLLAEAGVRAIVQPGGSKRDDEVIAVADKAGVPMVFTGARHFRH